MISIGSDHAGFQCKEKLKEYFKIRGISIKDFGTFSEDSCDYPIIAEEVSLSVASGESEKGILVCGTGIGMCIAANKVPGVRAALCYEPSLAQMSRSHNDANILCLGARVTPLETIKNIADSFINCAFEGGRHQKRVNQITDIENKN